MKRISCILACLLFCAGQVSTVARPTTAQITESSSFETDFDGWSIKATDVWGDPPEAWSITRSQDMARDGSTSVNLVLTNFNDAEKIWIEKPFAVEPNKIYQVTVEYALASIDTIDAGPRFTVITGALPSSPATREDLTPAYKDEAHNGTSTQRYKWDDRQYEFTVRSNEGGALYVVIGIWGTWEVRKTYYVDDVRVTISSKPETSQFYSFENDFEGWEANAAGVDLRPEPGLSSIERVQEVPLRGEDGKSSIRFDLDSQNGNGKIWIERPFMIERGRKYVVGLEYAFHSFDCSGNAPRFRILAGVFRRHPGEDVINSVQEKTTSCAWGWLHKSYDFTIKAKKTDTLYVVIGIWGTEEAHRTYNVDSICVTLTPK